MVVGQANHPGAQFDVAGALGSGSNENLWGGDNLPAGAVVLSDPGLVKAEVVEPLDQLQVALYSQGGIFSDTVEGAHEDAELHSLR
jgi:hypothetical protein